MREIKITTQSIFRVVGGLFKGLLLAYFAFIFAYAGYMLVTNWSAKVVGVVALTAAGIALLGAVTWYGADWVDRAQKNNRTLLKFGGKPKLAKARVRKINDERS